MKIKIYLLTALLMLVFGATATKAAAVVPTATTSLANYSKEELNKMSVEEKTARLQEIKDRVNEIKSMDKSTLTHEQKKELRVELREMRKEARAINSSDGMGGGIYLSVGAIIIIILLLILILK
ncbi:hypothetical protein BEL04_06855 [Mucilaginibacter sp. PPCGB 2223]|uniref:hypothetical protein n=1 Tax=Mucilaginibacter sp. PPCGB 2223 TaxID=1886027 RepID=UPI00082718FD|nr:hypothetical protein [Mucilaginibacter sp. PPCGB 2223]OCX53990.1 hypothetical protein BEL04_06855 [Mucilaginibacter sp. PPCGB 2223]